MSCPANSMIKQMQSYVGCKLGDSRHKNIVDTYNKYLGRTVMSYSAAWCATTVSAAAIKCNATDIIPVDCYCPTQLKSFKEKGVYYDIREKRNTNFRPLPGDIVYFDWNNNAVPDHVGIVESVSGNTVTSIEGNYSDTDSCQRRQFPYNWKFVIGYARPKYKVESTTNNNDTKVLQDLINRCKDRLHIITYDYLVEDGIYGPKTTDAVKEVQRIHGLTVDGVAGINTKSVLNQKYSVMTLPNVTIKIGYLGVDAKRLQAALNIAKLIQGNKTTYARINVDGNIGKNSEFAIKSFQQGNGLVSDGIAGPKTWAKLKAVLGCK